MDDETTLRAYRRRHVIRPVVHFGDPDYVYCARDGIRIIRRRGGWRHDPDAIKRLVHAVVIRNPFSSAV